MEIGLTILGYLLPVIASILTILLIAGARWLMRKLGVERSEKIDDLIDRYVKMGVNAAEASATAYLVARGEKMPSDDKMRKAVDAVMKELDQSGIKDVAEELITNRVEHWLLEEKKVSPPGDTGEDA